MMGKETSKSVPISCHESMVKGLIKDFRMKDDQSYQYY